MNNLKHYIIIAIILIAAYFFFQWRMGILQDKLEKAQSELITNNNNNFRVLSDSMSAKSKIENIIPPGTFDKLFNTAANKHYNEIRNMIPQVIKEEIKKAGLDSKTTYINKSTIELKGDSAIYRNDSGVVLKTAKVIPLNADSSMLIVLPQEIELTNVTIRPDSKNPDSIQVFLSAVNRTTGDTLKIGSAITYVLPGKQPKWMFTTLPYLGTGYDVVEKEMVVKAGIRPIKFNGKKMDISLMGLELNYGLKNNKGGVMIDLIQLQLKK